MAGSQIEGIFMGFWDTFSKVVDGINEYAEKKVEEKERKERTVRIKIKREQERNSSLSNEEILAKGRKSKKGSIERYAAAKSLQDRGAIPPPNKSNKSESFKSTNTTKRANGKNRKSKTESSNLMKDQTSPAFRPGSPHNKTTIILSAPGQCEETAGRPAAGQTGKTLQSAMNEWHKKDPEKFPSSNLDDYTIVNAVADVHYKGKTGRTEGSEQEIRNPKNVERLKKALNNSDTVVALGEKAQLAAHVAEFNGKTYSSGHPSMQSLNKRYKSDANTPTDRSSERIKQWAGDVLDDNNE